MGSELVEVNLARRSEPTLCPIQTAQGGTAKNIFVATSRLTFFFFFRRCAGLVQEVGLVISRLVPYVSM